jgi:malic enzyme
VTLATQPRPTIPPSTRHPYQIHRRPGGKPWIAEVSAVGHALRKDPMLNKGTAFPLEERQRLGLRGIIPPQLATLEDQLARVGENYERRQTDIDRYLYLVALQDRNETLFHRFALENLERVLPIIYTPTVGQACQEYSHIYRRPRGLYVTPEDIHRLDELLENSGLQEAALLVVTDGERILGTGDQGAGGIGISIGKLTLYTLGAGIHPTLTLPVVLDVGTDNEERLRDPLYLGRRERRLRGEPYFELLDAFVQAVRRRWPRAILQWEDLAKRNAFTVLDRYRDQLPSFNDDILGTGAVVLSGLTNAFELARVPMAEGRVLFLGAGEANIGSARALLASKLAAGASEADARGQMVFLDTTGLVHEGRPRLAPFKRDFAMTSAQAEAWPETTPDRLLQTSIEHFRPHALVGATGVASAFDEESVRALARVTARPIVFALSNPTALSEAQPEDVVRWTQGRAIIATGSPFPPVQGPSHPIPIAQANNMLIFPGVGLGAWISHAERITDPMFAAAARACAACVAPDKLAQGIILPTVGEIRRVSRAVALAAAQEAVRSGVAPEQSHEHLEERLELEIWEPQYMELVREDE